jgi:hypothetical protein
MKRILTLVMLVAFSAAAAPLEIVKPEQVGSVYVPTHCRADREDGVLG